MNTKDYICPVCGMTKQPLDDAAIEIKALRTDRDELTQQLADMTVRCAKAETDLAAARAENKRLREKVGQL